MAIILVVMVLMMLLFLVLLVGECLITGIFGIGFFFWYSLSSTDDDDQHPVVPSGHSGMFVYRVE